MSLKEDVEKVQKKIEETSFALEILKDIKKDSEELSKANKRQFIIILVILGLWTVTLAVTMGYLVYVLNDIETEEIITETTTTSQEISDVDSIDNSYIINGDNYGEN